MTKSLDGKPPPEWSVRKERVGNHKKYWTVRCHGKFVSVFNTKSEAYGWLYYKEKNGGYK